MKYFLLLIFFPLLVNAQNTIGFPDVINYQKSIYKAGLQTWDIVQDNNGIVYFANNEGLVTFDGRFWKLYPLPNKTIVRSVVISPEGRIYVGGQDEFGYFEPSNNGQLQYFSLKNQIPAENRLFGDVWDIVIEKERVFFRTTGAIFQFYQQQCFVYKPSSEWSFLGIANEKLFAHDLVKGLLIFDNNVWRPAETANSLPVNEPVTGILPCSGDSIMITTLKSGLYYYNGGAVSRLVSANDALFRTSRIYAATSVTSQWKAIGTNNNGIYIIDTRGNIIQSFSVKEQLQNNNVLSVFLDRQQNLWLGLNNGIDFIAYNSSIKHITPLMQNGSGYTALVHGKKLFLGTSNGLYTVPVQAGNDLGFEKGTFEKVANTDGQAWTLSAINDQLVLGHHDGAFVVNNTSATKISSNTGYWTFLPTSNIFPSQQMLGGNYNGLFYFDVSRTPFTQQQHIANFNESSRFVAIDQFQNIWISHPYHGVFKITKTPGGTTTTTAFTGLQGLPSILNNHIFKIQNEVVVATEKGAYRFDYNKNRFEPHPYYQQLLGNQSIRYLKLDNDKNLWFIHEKTLGVVNIGEQKPEILYLPELTNKMLSGFESIYPYNNNNIIVGGENGFYHINFAKYKNSIPALKVQVRSVTISNGRDSLLFGGYFARANDVPVQPEKAIYKIGNTYKTIHIEFASPVYGYENNLEYSYHLKGFDQHWSDWNKRTDKEYTNLPFGKYNFEVKVRNNLGNESPVVTYTFEVLPPWYQTIWAVLLYLAIGGCLVYFFYKRQQKKFMQQRLQHQAEQQKLVYIHDLEKHNAESEIINLRNQKLEDEINFKNSELASSAMHLVKKGELLAQLRSDLTQFMKKVETDKANGELKKLIKTLNDDENIDREWENFTRHFDAVHSDFVLNLKSKHPTVTSNEMKLSAYLRMNLSTKEIAQLMNISVRGVEVSRYRLRKKLGIASELSLFEYLIGLANNKSQ